MHSFCDDLGGFVRVCVVRTRHAVEHFIKNLSEKSQIKPSCRLTVDRAHAAGLGIFAIMSTAPRCTAGALRARASSRYAAHDSTFVPALRSIAPRGKGNHRRLVVWRAESSRPPEPARDTSDQDNVDARIRAERMAVRLKLASTAGAKKTTTGGRLNSSAATSFDAKIAEAEATASSNKSKVIEEERAAVRARMGKFRMNRYAFVNTGANAGGVYDRVTGEAAPVNDETFAIEDRVDLARERVKQAQQELVNAKAAQDAKERDLNERVAKLEKLAEELTTKRKEESAGEDGGKGAERKAILATMKEMQGDSSSPSTTAAGAGAAKIAVATSATSQTTGVESNDPKDAKARAADAIRARASSSLSRLRKHRKSRLSQASSLRKKPVTSTAAVETSTVAEHDPLRDAAASTASTAKEEDESLGSTLSRGAPTTPTVPGSNDVLPKPIFVLSDSTGESAANTCRAALGQFEELLNLAMPTNLYIFRFLDDPSDAYKIVRQAAEDDALVVYTLSAPEMVTSVMTACKLYKVESVNLWGPLLESMEAHLMMTRMGVPITERGASTNSHTSSEALSTDYYRMIEAVEFTRQMDDGARPDRWRDADILILGVSRTGKTPLSIYLGQRGYKVANLPLVPRDGQLMVPKYVHDVDPKRVFGLLINGEVLHDIRTNRLSSIGVKREDKGAMEYSTMRQVTQELSLAKALYAKNPGWTVLDVTHKGVEETSARIMKIMYQSENASAYSLMKAT